MKTPVDTPRVPGDAPGRYLNVGALSRDLAAAAVSVVVLLTSVVSFASLMFPGALAAGAPTTVWAMLVGSGIAGLWVALRSSLPPVSSGIDGATGAICMSIGRPRLVSHPVLRLTGRYAWAAGWRCSGCCC